MFDNDSGLPRTLRRISPPKAADVLADELRKRIRTGEWPEGLALPTERELASQSGLSRTSVREALRMLEVDGLIEIRPGRNGGAKVRRPAGHELTRQLDLFIWGRNIGVEHLHDVREALEALGAEGAALRRTDADIVELVAATEAVEAAVDDIDRYLDANLDWHLAVVRASHNELLVSFMNVLANAIHEVTESEVFDTANVREATLRIHRAILQAIVDGDADAARRRMARHVGAAREVALSEGPGQVAVAASQPRPATKPRGAKQPASAKESSSAPRRPGNGKSRAPTKPRAKKTRH
jgi:DNA-binding FadR family transcriptional regulator